MTPCKFIPIGYEAALRREAKWGSVSSFDLASHEVVDRFDSPGTPVRIKFNKAGTIAYIPSGPLKVY